MIQAIGKTIKRNDKPFPKLMERDGNIVLATECSDDKDISGILLLKNENDSIPIEIGQQFVWPESLFVDYNEELILKNV